VEAEKLDERGQRLVVPGPSSDGQHTDSGHATDSNPSLGAAMRRHRSFVLVPVVGLLALALIAGLTRTPTYTANTRLAVGGLSTTNPASLTGFADAAQQLAQTYSRSVQGDGVVGEVARQTGATPAQVRSHLSAAPIPETPVFTLEATSDSSDGAIRLSNLASKSLVAQVESASQSNPTRLLDEYRAAEVERQRISNRVNALSATGGTSLVEAQAELLAAEARTTSLRDAYGLSQKSGTVPLQIIQNADRASSDRLSVLQLYAFVAVIAGLVLGMALALFRDSPHHEGTIAAIGRLRGGLSSRRDGARRKWMPRSRPSRSKRAAGRRRRPRRARV
jgi:capsular polysaccharide biosynthesis protein